jgi:hypothetical protein
MKETPTPINKKEIKVLITTHTNIADNPATTTSMRGRRVKNIFANGNLVGYMVKLAKTSRFGTTNPWRQVNGGKWSIRMIRPTTPGGIKRAKWLEIGDAPTVLSATIMANNYVNA